MITDYTALSYSEEREFCIDEYQTGDKDPQQNVGDLRWSGGLPAIQLGHQSQRH